MFLSSEQQGPGLRTQKSKQTLSTLVGHHQVFLRSYFRHALTGTFRPEIHDFRVPGHAMTLRLLTLSKSAKNRQQIARKKVRITVSLQHILNVICILPLEHDLLEVMLEPFKVLLFPDRNITWLAVLSSRTFPLTRLPNSGSNTLTFSVRISSAERTAKLKSSLSPLSQILFG